MKRTHLHPLVWLTVALLGVGGVLAGLGGGRLIVCVGCVSQGLALASGAEGAMAPGVDACCPEAGDTHGVTGVRPGPEPGIGSECSCVQFRLGGELPDMAMTPGAGSGSGTPGLAPACLSAEPWTGADPARCMGQRGPPHPTGAGTGLTLFAQHTSLRI
ncbi:MAG: hypothetical protein IT431_12665 [Phycisphaerales bacterium]|nr:hypothetical protein [Phycisphaerales bacterium]